MSRKGVKANRFVESLNAYIMDPVTKRSKGARLEDHRSLPYSALRRDGGVQKNVRVPSGDFRAERISALCV